jgi:cell division protein FtsX
MRRPTIAAAVIALLAALAPAAAAETRHYKVSSSLGSTLKQTREQTGLAILLPAR